NQLAAECPPSQGAVLQLPRWPRVLTGALGGSLLVAASAIFIRPQAAIDRWPWALTPLTARTLAAFATFLGVVWLAFAFTREWDRLAIPFEATTLGLVIVCVAVLRGRHDLAGGTRTLVFGLLLGGAVLGSSALLAWAGRHRPETRCQTSPRPIRRLSPAPSSPG